METNILGTWQLLPPSSCKYHTLYTLRRCVLLSRPSVAEESTDKREQRIINSCEKRIGWHLNAMVRGVLNETKVRWAVSCLTVGR